MAVLAILGSMCNPNSFQMYMNSQNKINSAFGLTKYPGLASPVINAPFDRNVSAGGKFFRYQCIGLFVKYLK